MSPPADFPPAEVVREEETGVQATRTLRATSAESPSRAPALALRKRRGHPRRRDSRAAAQKTAASAGPKAPDRWVMSVATMTTGRPGGTDASGVRSRASHVAAPTRGRASPAPGLFGTEEAATRPEPTLGSVRARRSHTSGPAAPSSGRASSRKAVRRPRGAAGRGSPPSARRCLPHWGGGEGWMDGCMHPCTHA